MKRLIVIATVFVLLLSVAPSAEAGPIRRAIRAVARAATAPVRAVRGRGHGHGLFHGRYHQNGCTSGSCAR